MRWLIALWCLIASHAVSAAEFTLDLSLGSKHYKTQGYDYNETNPGLGIGVMEDFRSLKYGFKTGFYVNSYDKTSAYFMGALQHPLIEEIDIGILAGVVSGYNNLPGDYFGGMLYVERPIAGIVNGRIGWIPALTERAGTFTFQLSLELGNTK